VHIQLQNLIHKALDQKDVFPGGILVVLLKKVWNKDDVPEIEVG
jgi:hypothetical protein